MISRSARLSLGHLPRRALMSLDISLNTGVQNTFHRSRGPSHRSQSESVIPVAQKFLFSQQQNLIASFLLLSTSLSLLFDKIVGEKPRCFLRKILTELDPCPRIEQRNRRTRRFHASRRYSPILTIISFTKGRKKEEIGGLVAWKSCVQSPWIRCSLRVAGSLATVVARNLPDRWSGRPGGDRVALDACDGEAGEGGGWRGGGSKRPPFLVVENPRGFDSLYLLRSSIDQIKLDPGKFSSLRRGERKRWSRDALSRRNEIPFPSLILG